MQDAGYRLPRIPLPGNSVNKGDIEKDWSTPDLLCGLMAKVEQKGWSPKSRKKLQEQYSGLGQLTLSVEYDAVVMRPEICIGAWDRYPPLSRCEIPVPLLGG
jgi:hypothetical protein